MRAVRRPRGISLIALAMALSAVPVGAQQAERSRTKEEDVVTVSSDNDENDPKSMSSDEIFKRMFGKEPPPVETNKFTVLIDGINAGEALIDPSPDGWISSDFLKMKVLPILLPEAADRLRPLLQTERVSFSSLKNLSYDVQFDRRDLILVLQIPFDLRGERIVMIGRQPNATVVDVIPQADVSAFVSVRGGFDWIQKSDNEDTGLSGFAADIDTAINIKGAVLEAEFRFDENSKKTFSRGDIRLVYDDVDSLIRYEAGDLSISRRPFQNAPKIAGFSAYREFGINPYMDPRPVGERGVTLERAARVEIVVNGTRSRAFDLPAGRYSLRDFPIVPGATNDVELIVTYVTGEVETFVFPAFTSIDLLEEGTSEFALNFGVPYDDIENVRKYDTDEFNIIGFYRKGVTSTLTLGASIEANNDIAVLGGEASWASPIGNFGLNVSNDLRNPGLESGRLSLQYAWRSPDPFTGLSFDGLLILTGEEYRTLDQIFGGGSSRVFASGRANKAFGNDTRFQIGGSYQLSNDRNIDGERVELWTATATLSRQFGRVNISGSLDYQNSSDQGSELIGRVNLFIPLGKGTASASYVSKDNSFRADYRKSSRSAVGAFGYSVGLQRNDNGDQQYLRANYVGNRFEAAVEQLRTNSPGDTDIRTGVALGTALVMADGKVSLSRPVQNGFAIIDNGSSVDAQLAIEPRSSPLGGKREYAAYSDFMGAGVVPDLPAYFIRRVEVEAPEAPAGSGLGGEVFVLKPGYRAGYSLEVGEEGGNVSVLGNLVFDNGEPASMLSGTVKRIDGDHGDPAKAGDDEPDALFFTNASGRFFVEGLDPGSLYEIVILVNGDPQKFVLTTPKDAFGIWRMDEPVAIDGGSDEN